MVEVIGTKPDNVILEDEGEKFGIATEFITGKNGDGSIGIAEIILFGSDILHEHKKTKEVYFFRKGRGRLFLDGKIIDVKPGDRVIIPPGTLHAAMSLENGGALRFFCVSVPALDSKDVFEDPRRRLWALC